MVEHILWPLFFGMVLGWLFCWLMEESKRHERENEGEDRDGR